MMKARYFPVGSVSQVVCMIKVRYLSICSTCSTCSASTKGARHCVLWKPCTLVLSTVQDNGASYCVWWKPGTSHSADSEPVFFMLTGRYCAWPRKIVLLMFFGIKVFSLHFVFAGVCLSLQWRRLDHFHPPCSQEGDKLYLNHPTAFFRNCNVNTY